MNPDGMEQIRFNRIGLDVIPTAESELQDKSHRSYYQNSIDLEFGEMYLSNLEVNREFGDYERPYRLVTRLVTPIFCARGSLKGYLVANIDFNSLAHRINNRFGVQKGVFIVKSSDEAWYYKDRVYIGKQADSIISHTGVPFVAKNEVGESAYGLTVSRTSFVQRDAFQGRIEELGMHSLKSDVSETEMFIWIPSEAYFNDVHENILYLLLLQTFFVVTSAFFAYRWAKFRVTEEITFAELYKSNKLLKESEDKLADANDELSKRLATQEEEIEDAHRLLSAMFDSSMHFAGIMRPDGTIINVNKKTLDTLGIRKSDVVGKKVWEFDTFGDKDMVEEAMTHAISKVTQGETMSFETVMFSRTGDKHRVAFSLSPLYNDDGQITHLIPEGSDITALRERDKQLRGVVEQLENRNKQLKEFSHIVSHNVRSPIGNLNLLLDIYDDAENEQERAEIMEKLKQVNSSLNELLEELLETVKILDHDEIESDMNSVGDAIRQAQKLLSRQIEDAEVVFDVDIENPSEVYYPKVYLSSLLLNLMSNAIKYRSDDRRLHIEISTRINEDGECELRFSDNGSGIDMKRYGHKVFGLHKTFHRNKPGKGLGLFMTKTQVESCGGSIKVSSQVDEGTTFIVTFQRPVII
ncbi:MAG: PAS domain S-box protein [Oceanospirillaceae bacterium]|nr:PAS domain S-box protein [Oceanospirillaceae bacterium]